MSNFIDWATTRHYSFLFAIMMYWIGFAVSREEWLIAAILILVGVVVVAWFEGYWRARRAQEESTE